MVVSAQHEHPDVVERVGPDGGSEAAQGVDRDEGEAAHGAEYERAELEGISELADVVPAADRERRNQGPGESRDEAARAALDAERQVHELQAEAEAEHTEYELLVEA